MDKKTLLKLIDDYGHAMYNLGECSGDYEAKQAGLTKKKITVYIESLKDEVKVFDFSDIFNFATKEYGISWNECSDVFFGNSLEYMRHSTVYPSDWSAYADPDIIKDKASDYSKEEVAAMCNLDKSYVILSAYFESLNITDSEVLVDCT